MTTRREFIKILTGTVIAISLPMGLFSNSKEVAEIRANTTWHIEAVTGHTPLTAIEEYPGFTITWNPEGIISLNDN